MEPITAAFFAIIAVAFGTQLEKQQLEIHNLEEWNYRLSGEVSSLSGREKMNDDFQQRQIEAIKKWLEDDNAPVAE